MQRPVKAPVRAGVAYRRRLRLSTWRLEAVLAFAALGLDGHDQARPLVAHDVPAAILARGRVVVEPGNGIAHGSSLRVDSRVGAKIIPHIRSSWYSNGFIPKIFILF